MRKTTLIKNIEKLRTRIGKDRDDLRELISEARELKETCIEAFESLDYAADQLSQYA